jgi:hypothetical protein
VSKQPEALRLADALDSAPYSSGCTNEAAAELRRQHAEIERLRIEKARWETAVLNCVAMSNGREDEWGSRAEWAFGFLHAAIAKAEEVKP